MLERQMKNSGRPLDPLSRDVMERRFQTDFSDVRLHDGPQANALARFLEAEACAVGPDILFAAPFSGDRGLLAHELTHVVQARNSSCEHFAVFSWSPPAYNSEIESEARIVAERVLGGWDAGPIRCALNTIACSVTSKAIENLISYSITDWKVTEQEQRQVLTLLAGDTSPVNTINDLKDAGMMGALIGRVDGAQERLELMQVLGAKLDDAVTDSILYLIGGFENWQVLRFLLQVSHDLQANFRTLRLTNAASAFNAAALAYVIGKAPNAPFSGSGATGKNPTKHPSIPRLDQVAMAAGIESVRRKYHNPVGGLNVYLSSLSPQERKDQAQLLLRQPVSSIVPYSYLGATPSRADVIKAAAGIHNLHGPAIAAFILAEQRDQSSNEDAKDYQSAVSILSYNSSIGLGQVVVSTARNNNLFSDLLRASTLSGTYGRGLSALEIAMLLASDDFNIFAAAKYIRKTANDGAAMRPASLPNTVAAWPGVDFAKYRQNSRNWPDDNIAALGSEYTSSPWDDRVTAWGDFVLEAYRDVVASGVF